MFRNTTMPKGFARLFLFILPTLFLSAFAIAQNTQESAQERVNE